MTPQEALILTRLVRAGCPAQKFDEYTPDLWAEVFAKVDFTDARAALVRLLQRQPFVAPADIIGEIGRARREERDRERSSALRRELAAVPEGREPDRAARIREIRRLADSKRLPA